MRVLITLMMLSLSWINAHAMTEQALIVHGWKQAELQRILIDFSDLYKDRPAVSFEVSADLHRNGVLKVEMPNGCPADLFKFLVNYIQYPIGFDLHGRQILVLGRARLGKGSEVPDKAMLSEPALIYVPADDQEHDQVFIHVLGATYKISFTNMEWQKVDAPRFPSALKAMMAEGPIQIPDSISGK